MNRKLNSQRADLWRERLARQAAGPRSVVEFCRREGVSQPSFYQWRKRLGSTRPQGHSGANRRDAADVEFVSVELPESLSRTGIQIDLPSGAVVRLPGDATAEMIATVVQAACGSGDTQGALG